MSNPQGLAENSVIDTQLCAICSGKFFKSIAVPVTAGAIFLADVLMQPIKDIWNNLKIGEENLLVLEGKTRDAIPFYGSQWILVVDNKPQGRP